MSPPPKKLVNNYCKARIKETKKRHKTEKEQVRMDKNTVMDRQEGYRTSIRMGKHTKDEGQNTPTPRAAHRHPGSCPGHRCHSMAQGTKWSSPKPVGSTSSLSLARVSPLPPSPLCLLLLLPGRPNGQNRDRPLKRQTRRTDEKKGKWGRESAQTPKVPTVRESPNPTLVLTLTPPVLPASFCDPTTLPPRALILRAPGTPEGKR